MGIADLFDVVVTDDDVARPKPSPDGRLLVLDSLSASREGAVFVGDMDADVEAARRARVTSVGAAWCKPSISSPRPVGPRAGGAPLTLSVVPRCYSTVPKRWVQPWAARAELNWSASRERS